MPKSFYACLSAVLVLVMLAFAYGEADAARIGGGRSFGGRPSMSQPYTKPLPSNPSSSFNRRLPASSPCIRTNPRSLPDSMKKSSFAARRPPIPV